MERSWFKSKMPWQDPLAESGKTAIILGDDMEDLKQYENLPKGAIIDPYTMMCDTCEGVVRSTTYCNYCGTHIYSGHTEACQAYDTKFDFMKQVRRQHAKA